METQEQLQEIFKKYLSRQASAEEIRLMMHHFHTGNQFFLDDLLLKEFESLNQIEHKLPALPDRVFKHIQARIGLAKQPARHRVLWFRFAAAAAITILFSAALYLAKNFNDAAHSNNFAQNDIKPGSKKAILVLPNGTAIKLSDLKKGILTGSTQLTYDDGTPIGRQAQGNQKGNPLNGLISIITPKGGTYQVTLPDGTSVMLNAGSTLKFPATFAGMRQRKVELDGEGYFEVSHNKNIPFLVATDHQLVEVLGTHFNVNSYKDEQSVKTTLLEGSVKVTPFGSREVLWLQPGQQAVLQSGKLNLRKADLAVEMAWKNGEFIFTNNDFRTEMRKVARWYNVEVVYDASVPENIRLGGFISRDENISAVLRLIELTGKVHFKIEGRRVFVTR